MARPRVYIRVIELPDGSLQRTKRKSDGREITGLSFNEGNQRYYTLDSRTRKRVYHGADLGEALAAIGHYDPHDGRTWSDEQKAAWEARQNTQVEIETRLQDLPHGELDNVLGTITTQPTQPAKERLSHCLDVWATWMMNGNSETTNVKDTKRHFRAFIRCVGNLPVSEIKHSDFVKYQESIRRKAAKREWTIKTAKDYHGSIKKVFEFAKRKNRDWRFPDGILEWADDYKLDYKTPYVPDPKNKKPIAVEDFRKCLALVDSWAAIDPNEIPATNQKGRGKRKQAGIRQREGIQWAFLLRLMVNGSLDNKDCTRLEWKNFKQLDGKMPHLDFPREKPRHKTGFAIPRFIPLLPGTLDYLRRWQKYERQNAFVFRTSQGTPYTSDSIHDTFKRIVRAAKTDHPWTAKNLRNVAPSLGKKAKLSRDERQAILGHACKGTNTPYEDDDVVDETFLIRLVNLIGTEYFG